MPARPGREASLRLRRVGRQLSLAWDLQKGRPAGKALALQARKSAALRDQMFVWFLWLLCRQGNMPGSFTFPQRSGGMLGSLLCHGGKPELLRLVSTPRRKIPLSSHPASDPGWREKRTACREPTQRGFLLNATSTFQSSLTILGWAGPALSSGLAWGPTQPPCEISPVAASPWPGERQSRALVRDRRARKRTRWI